jgi:CheY-like chemotaxis protein
MAAAWKSAAGKTRAPGSSFGCRRRPRAKSSSEDDRIQALDRRRRQGFRRGPGGGSGALWPHQTEITFTGEDGITAAQRTRYDAIFIDIGLPGINGVESLLRIREFDPKARCFLLTGYSADHIAAQGLEAGAVEILTKPIEIEDILRRLSGIPSGS